ncbi:MAG: protein translocase subunit SecD [Bacteriovoracaceae bacterium]|nr:protein translocase subunit SecD [Bacteriovoracaceae bacterium]
MKSSWWMRFSFLLVLVVLSILLIIPTAMKFSEDSSYPFKSKINLGLDLQGGLYMVLGIDFKKVYTDEVKGYGRKIETLMKDKGIKLQVGSVDSTDPMDPKQMLILEKASDMVPTIARIKEFYQGLVRITKEDGVNLEIAVSSTIKKQIEEQSVGKSIEVIRNRIDEFGVTEPEILSQGSDRIIVQLPGVRDIERAKDLIGKTARLEFKMVNDTVSPTSLMDWMKKAEAAQIVFKKGDRFSDYLKQMNEFLKADLPQGYELAFERRTTKVETENDQLMPYLVEVAPQITGDDLQDARVEIDQQRNEPYVSMEFKPQGAVRFEKITGENIGRRMAVILDGNVYSAPNIQTKIGGGRAQITMGGGNFNNIMKEAKDLALVLRAGALPVQLDFLEQRTIGPNLGADAIKSAQLGATIGLILTFVFAVLYYKMSGVIAVGTLVVNLLFTFACLVMLEATLTLPGIAGLALTVAMAVDGNIIIFERVREEMRKGLSAQKAFEVGYDNALWTILDSNITTAAAGICLLNFGTGPIRGFAVTLLIGIVVTVYTSYFVSKVLYELYLEKVSVKELSI